MFAIGQGKDYPAIINDHSNVSVYAATFGMSSAQQWPIAVREIQDGECRQLLKADMPVWFMESYVIPLYVGRAE